MKKQLSRRRFLKNTTTALGTAAISGLWAMGYAKNGQKSNAADPGGNQLDLPQVFFTPDINSDGLLNI